MTFRRAVWLLAADLREREAQAGKRYGWFSYVKIWFNPAALAVAFFRIQAWLHAAGWRRLATGVRNINIVLFSIDIGSRAQIDAGFIICHPNCVVIGDECVAGRKLILVHHNTIIMRGPGAAGRVEIADDVTLGCGSRILGPVSVGANSFIGANAVVRENLPASSFHIETELTYLGEAIA